MPQTLAETLKIDITCVLISLFIEYRISLINFINFLVCFYPLLISRFITLSLFTRIYPIYLNRAFCYV